MHGAMKTHGRPCFYSSFTSRSLKTQMKQITFSRGNLVVEGVTQRRHAASHVSACKHIFNGGNLVPFLFLFPFLGKTFLHVFPS